MNDINKKLNKCLNECLKEVDSVGIPHGKITKIVPNYRAKSYYGMCVQNDEKQNTYTIVVTQMIYRKTTPKKSLKQVVIHEILHTCPDCMNHGEKWKKYARIMNETYGYDIKRVWTPKELNIKTERMYKSKLI